MKIASKLEIIIEKILNILFLVLFLLTFNILAEIFHRNVLNFYGFLLFLLIQLIFFLSSTSLGGYLIGIYVLEDNYQEANSTKLLEKGIIDIIFSIIIIPMIIDLSKIYVNHKNQTYIDKKLNLINCVKK